MMPITTELVMDSIRESKNRKEAATVYVSVIQNQSSLDIKAINKVMFDRWSESGVQFIKKLAWKKVEILNSLVN